MTHAIVDVDFIKYAVAGAGEKRDILVTHKTTGNTKVFKNRTEFYGRGKKKDGGWLGERNAGRTSPFTLDEFEIIDRQHPDPVENVLHSAKMMFQRCVASTGASTYKGYIGKGDSFRVARSTILKYKGNREEMLRPVHMAAVEEYLLNRFNIEVVTELEADDQCVIDCYGNDNILVGVDKDYYGCPVKFLNIDRPDEGVIDCDQFGKLYIDAKGKVRGYGRMFFYFQVANGDSSDHYCANSASPVPWADKSAYNALKDATTDLEAWRAIVDVYKKLYPEPNTVVGWRGEEITVDWLYALSENFDMARMLRWEGDKLDVAELLADMQL